MKVVNTRDDVGTARLWDADLMAGQYERGNEPEWTERDDGLLECRCQQEVGEALIEAHEAIVAGDDAPVGEVVTDDAEPSGVQSSAEDGGDGGDDAEPTVDTVTMDLPAGSVSDATEAAAGGSTEADASTDEQAGSADDDTSEE